MKSSATGLSDIHPDIIDTHILNRLDGCSLAAVNCTSSQLRTLSSRPDLWSHICQSSWPSTGTTPQIQQLISTFPKGPLSFFSLASSQIEDDDDDDDDDPNRIILPSTPSPSPSPDHLLPLLVSAVDVFYRGNPILSKISHTQTQTCWFNSAPFRIDLLDPKEILPTPIPGPYADDHHTCRDLFAHLHLSWILIDPNGKRAANLSSLKPVSVDRHWLSGEVQAKFATVVRPRDRHSSPPVMITVQVTFTTEEGRREDNGMGIREVALEIEGLDGPRLTGAHSLSLLNTSLLEARRRRRRRRTTTTTTRRADGKTNANTSCKKASYEEFMEMRRERTARKTRDEGRWDLMCVAVGVVGTVFAATAFLTSFWS